MGRCPQMRRRSLTAGTIADAVDAVGAVVTLRSPGEPRARHASARRRLRCPPLEHLVRDDNAIASHAGADLQASNRGKQARGRHERIAAGQGERAGGPRRGRAGTQGLHGIDSEARRALAAAEPPLGRREGEGRRPTPRGLAASTPDAQTKTECKRETRRKIIVGAIVRAAQTSRTDTSLRWLEEQIQAHERSVDRQDSQLHALDFAARDPLCSARLGHGALAFIP